MADQFIGKGNYMFVRFLTVGAALGLAIIWSLPAEAQARRANSTSMTCAQVQNMIAQRGAVVMNTGPNTFDRYVSGRGFCQISEYARADNVPTKDNPKCQVRRCVNTTPRSFSR